jgi:hypothetical protein
MAGWGAAAFAAAALASCGGSDPQPQARFRIEPPSRPAARECGLGAKPSKVARKVPQGAKPVSPPKSGIYRYRLVGTATVTGTATRARDLPANAQLLVSPARRIGKASCFRIQRRLGPEIANTDTYLIRGGEIYLVGLVIQALGETQRIHPDPAVLTATESGSEWSGQFGGRTAGSYRFSVGGNKRIRVGKKRVKAVQVTSSIAYRGAFDGMQTGTIWLSRGHQVVLSEKVRSRQGLGINTLRLRTSAQLRSLHPRPLRDLD